MLKCFFPEIDCLASLKIVSTYSPQDPLTLKTLRSRNIQLSNRGSAWCSRAHNEGQWIRLDLGRMRTISVLVTLGYPVGTEPGFDNFTMQLSYDNVTYYDYEEGNTIKVFSIC